MGVTFKCKMNFISRMFNRRTNPNKLRLNCSDCNTDGRPFTNDADNTVVGCGNCGLVWDGFSGITEKEIYDALKN